MILIQLLENSQKCGFLLEKDEVAVGRRGGVLVHKASFFWPECNHVSVSRGHSDKAVRKANPKTGEGRGARSSWPRPKAELLSCVRCGTRTEEGICDSFVILPGARIIKENSLQAHLGGII